MKHRRTMLHRKKNVLIASLLLVNFMGFCLPTYAKQSSQIVSQQTTTKMTVSYIVGEHESLVSAKAGAKEKLIQKASTELPTYISTSRTITNKKYSERVRFIAAGLVQISNEKYVTTSSQNNSLSIELTADVSIDGKALEQQIAQLNVKEQRELELDELLHNDSKINAKLSMLRTLYTSENRSKVDSLIADVLTEKTENYNRVNIKRNVNLIGQAELFQKKQKADDILREIERKRELTSEQTLLEELNAQVKQYTIDSFERQLNRPLELKIRAVKENQIWYKVTTVKHSDDDSSGYRYWWSEDDHLMGKLEKAFGRITPLRSGCEYLGKKDNEGYVYSLNASYQNVLFESLNTGEVSKRHVNRQKYYSTNLQLDSEYLKPDAEGVIYYMSVRIGSYQAKKPFIFYENYGRSIQNDWRVQPVGKTITDETNYPRCSKEIKIEYPWLDVDKSLVNDNATVEISIIKS